MIPREPKPTVATARAQPSRRPKFDKEASTTWLLAALVGLGAGATWQLLQGQPPAVQATAPAQVLVVDTAGRVLGTYAGKLANTQAPQGSSVTLAGGRAKAAKAATRAS